MRQAAVDDLGAAASIGRVAACSRRQLLAGVVLCAAVVGLALLRHAYAWLALFGALLLPLSAASAAVQALAAAQAWRGAPMRWRRVWAVLLAALALSSAAAAQAYHHGLIWAGMDGFDTLQVCSSAAAFGLLVLALPLWIAQSQARALHLSNLTQAALAADLKALQAQIEPHFLYNTLANTRYLARHAPPRAVEMLDHLIAYLHSALPDLRRPASSLGREFELAGHYLAVMEVRFGERLRFSLDCPAALAGAELPPSLLMPLVENAVQHGVEPQTSTVNVALEARQDGRSLVLTVFDDGAGVGQGGLGSGVGLRNVRQRLAALYGDRASVALQVGADGRTASVLALPLTLSPDISTSP